MAIDAAVETIVFDAMEPVDELRPGEGLAGAGGECGQQIELDGRQRDRLAVEGDLMSC